MDKKSIIIEKKGVIKVVRLNKPKKKNAIDIDMYLELTKIFDETAKEDDVMMLVLTGTGDYYCSGNDMSTVINSDMPHEERLDIVKGLVTAFIEFPKILVAIVNGPAIGIAATTIPFCDFVFATENAFFHTTFTNMGITPEGCSTVTFPINMGYRKATEMLLFSKKLTAREALNCGFINEIYKKEDEQKIWERLLEITHLSMPSVLVTKKLLMRNKKELRLVNDIEFLELLKIMESGEVLTRLQSRMARKSKI